MSSNAIDAVKADIVQASHILNRHGVLDGYGHVSARNSLDPDQYFISRDIAPGLLAADDVMTFDLDSKPAGGDTRKSFIERYIHGEIYKQRPDVHAIVHCHSPDLVTFSTVETPLRPIFHMPCAALAGGVARFEIREHEPDSCDMLVRSAATGAGLARDLGPHNLILMRGHGATVVAPTVPDVVFRAIYSQSNARVQMQAMALGTPRFLSDGEAETCTAIEVGRAWLLWCQEAG